MTPPRRVAPYGNAGGHHGEIGVVRAIYDAFGRQDIEAALHLIDEEAEVNVPATATAVGRTEPYRGHDGVRAYFADASRVWEQLAIEADDIRATGNSVVVFGHVVGRVGDDVVRRRVVWTWKLRDGKAVSLRVSDLGDARQAG